MVGESASSRAKQEYQIGLNRRVSEFAQILINDLRAAQSRLLTFAQEPLLRYRRDQGPVAAEDQASREAPCTARVGTVLCIEQPFIGLEWPVEP